jgi:hypothetical protein
MAAGPWGPEIEAESDAVAHACNLSYLGSRDKRTMVRGQSMEKSYLRPHLNKQV